MIYLNAHSLKLIFYFEKGNSPGNFFKYRKKRLNYFFINQFDTMK